MSEALALTVRAQTYRDYPEELKASVIAAIERNGGNVLATSKLFNLPRDTVNYWWYNSARYVENQHEKIKTIADKCESIAHGLADSLEAHDLSIVPFVQKATAFGIVIDKMQLLRGEPTSIPGLSEDERRLRLAELMERIQARAVAP